MDTKRMIYDELEMKDNNNSSTFVSILNILLKIDEGDKLAKQLYDKRIFTGKM
jgi:hypothetical protein